MKAGEREAGIARLLELKAAGAEIRDMRHLPIGAQPGAGAVALIQGGVVVAEVSPAMWIRFYPSGETVYLSLHETDRLIAELLGAV